MVRAIDVQQAIMQIGQGEKVQQVQQNHPEMQQRYFELHLREEKRQQQARVKSAEETEGEIVKEGDEREKRRSTDGRQDGKESASQQEEEAELPHRGEHVNIKV